MSNFYFFEDNPVVKDYPFPISYIEMAKNGFPDIDPWWWLAENKDYSNWWYNTVNKQFPSYKILIPFAKDGGSDDIACFDGTDTSGDPKVFYIHTFCTPGWEYRGEAKNFLEWYEEMKRISEEFKADN